MIKNRNPKITSHLRNEIIAAALVAALLSPTAALAQQYTNGKVTGYVPFSSGTTQYFLFSIDSNLMGDCNTTYRYAITSNSAQFKSVQAAVMAAYHSQSPIKVNYYNTCNSWGNAWDLNYVCIGTIPC